LSPGVPAIHANLEISVGPCVRANDDGVTRRPPDSDAFAAVTADFQRRPQLFYLPPSTNGRALLLTAGDHVKAARIWDAATGSAIAALERPPGYWNRDRQGPPLADFNWTATFSGDGSRVLMGLGSGETAVWETATGHLVGTLHVPGMAIEGASLNDNGTRAVLAHRVGQDRSARTDLVSWDVGSGGHNRPVASDVIAWVTNDTGTRFLLEQGYPHGHFRVWSESVDEPRPSITISDAIPLRVSLAFRGDQPLVAVLREEGKNDATVDLWDLMKQESHTMIAAGGATEAVLVPGGRYLVTSTTDTDGVERKTVRDIIPERKISSFDTGRAPLYRARRPELLYSADGTRYGDVDLSDHVRAWDLATGQQVASWSGCDLWLDFATVSPDGKLLATLSRSEGGEIHISGSGTPSARMSGLAGKVRSAAFSDDGRRLVAADDRGKVRVWESATGRVLLALNLPPVPEWASAGMSGLAPFGIAPGERTPVVALSPDGTRLVTANRAPGGVAAVTDVDSGHLVYQLALPARSQEMGPPTEPSQSPDFETFKRTHWRRLLAPLADFTAAVTFSPEGSWIAISWGDGFVGIWNAADGALLMTLDPGQLYHVRMPDWRETERSSRTFAMFTPDGRHLAVSDYIGRVVVWDTRTGERVHDAQISPDSLERFISISPDGGSLAADDRFWDLATGKPSAAILPSGPDAVLGAVGWTRDGRSMAVTCDAAPRGGSSQPKILK
jgi:WD40 repeat protein